MRLIAVMNQKGGVGKSTTTLNLAHALSLTGKSVTIIDMDPQGHLGAGFGLDNNAQPGIDAVLLDHANITQNCYNVREHLDLVPAGPRLAEFDMATEGGSERGWYLYRAISQGLADRDIVLIDCPPSTGMLSMNALMAAHEVLVPVCGDYFSLHSLSRFIKILEHIDNTLQRHTKVWIALTRYQARRRLAQDVRDKLLEYFPDSVLPTAIRECVALAESPSFGKSIFEYRASSHGATDYRSLAQEVADMRTL